jgi:hypothetical protein
VVRFAGGEQHGWLAGAGEGEPAAGGAVEDRVEAGAGVADRGGDRAQLPGLVHRPGVAAVAAAVGVRPVRCG